MNPSRRSPQQLPVVSQGHGQQPDPDRVVQPPRPGRQARTPPAHGPGEHEHLALGDLAERPRGGRLERGDTGRVRFAHEAGRVDLVAEHHHAAHAAQPGAGRGHERGQDIGGPVRPGQAGVTHRPGDHHRRVRGVHQVQQESRLLDRVGALDRHRARRPRGNLARNRTGQVQHVFDGEGGTRQAADVVNGYLGTDPAQTGHRGEQVNTATLGRVAIGCTRRGGAAVRRARR